MCRSSSRGGGSGVEAETLAAVEVTWLFAAEALLPEQSPHPPAEGWLQRLCLAVLDDALKCLGVGGTYRGPRPGAHQTRSVGISAVRCRLFPIFHHCLLSPPSRRRVCQAPVQTML